MSIVNKMVDMETFLAYSVALEEEAAARHDELADMLDVHNNPGVASTFRKLAHYSRLHAQEILEHSKGRTLPVIAPWDFEWEDMEGPETADPGAVNYLMNTAQALQIAMNNEQRAHDFYFNISRFAKDSEIRTLAGEFAEEEMEHLELLKMWVDRTDESADEVVFDPDPPHMPE
jgi:rubrerythrin